MLFCRNSSTKPEDRGNHSYRLVFLFPDCQMSLRHPSNLKPPYGNFHTSHRSYFHNPQADEPFDACNVMFVSYLYAQTNSTRLFFLPQLCGCKSSVALEYPAEIKRVVIPHRHGNILYSQRGIVSNEVGGH